LPVLSLEALRERIPDIDSKTLRIARDALEEEEEKAVDRKTDG
jgi:hypothetical protein